MTRRAWLLIPLLILGGLVILFYAGLHRDPRLVPSPLVGKPAPAFSLPRLGEPEKTLTRTDLEGRVTLLNVWATWCVGCREEHALLVDIARTSGIPIYGLNYKDQYQDALEWLERLGDPYVASGYDAEGAVGIDLGVYGLPETFVLDPNGVVAHKHIGPLTVQAWQRRILPVIMQLRDGSG